MAIKMISFKCPNCNAPLECEDGKQFWFCHHCGHKCIVDDERVKINVNYSTNVDLNGDAAEYVKALSKAEIEKIISQNPELLKLKMEQDNESKKRDNQTTIIMLGFCVLIIFFMLVFVLLMES